MLALVRVRSGPLSKFASFGSRFPGHLGCSSWSREACTVSKMI